MKTTKNQADAVRSYLAGIGHEITHCQALEVIARGEGVRSRLVKFGSSGSHQANPAAASNCPRCDAENALRECSCAKCGSLLKGGYCPDAACMYNDWPQVVLQYDIHEFATADVEKKYGIKKRIPSEQELSEILSDEAHSDRIRQDYFDSGCSRSDLNEAVFRLLAECAELFEGEESAVVFLHEAPSDDESVPLSSDDLAEQIKAEYGASRGHADDAKNP